MAEAPASDVLDDFNRADENPLSQGGLWGGAIGASGFSGAAKIVTNAATGTGVNVPTGSYRAATCAANCEAYTTVTTLPNANANYVLLAVRYDSSAVTGYFVQARKADFWFIFRMDGAATNTQIATTSATITMALNDVLIFRAVRDTLVLYRNGLEVLRVTDSTYVQAGSLGVGGRDTTLRVDNFGGGPYNGASYLASWHRRPIPMMKGPDTDRIRRLSKRA